MGLFFLRVRIRRLERRVRVLELAVDDLAQLLAGLTAGTDENDNGDGDLLQAS